MQPSYTLFKVEDINSVIKIFAYNIQDRIQEIDGFYHSSQQQDDSTYYINRYKGYTTSDPDEIKYIHKMVSRIIQILKFFKERSKNQSIMELIITKIQQKMNKMIGLKEIDIGKIISFILSLSLYGFKINTGIVQHKKITKSSSKAINSSTNDINENIQQQMFRRRKTFSFHGNKKTKTQPKFFSTKEQNQKCLEIIYSILDIDVGYLARLVENRPKVEKDRQRSNIHIMNKIKSYEREWKRKKQYEDHTLKQVKNKPVQPLLNNWISRKRKIIAQKKKTDIQNINILS